MKESEIIELITSEQFFPASRRYIGDDCAKVQFPTQTQVLVSTDSLVEGVHFLPGTAPYDLAWKLAAVNISDIAAMAGIPAYLLISTSLPDICSKEIWVKAFLQGLKDICEEYSITLVGGDLTKSNVLFLNATIIGYAHESVNVSRSNAQVGDKILVSGQFGNSSAGLWLLEKESERPAGTDDNNAEFFINAHRRPVPKVRQARALADLCSGKMSMMDASDGLLDCLEQIAHKSGVKLRFHLDHVPLDHRLPQQAYLAEKDLWEWVLAGGEDFELLACANPNKIPEGWFEIGEVQEGIGLEAIYRNKPFELTRYKIFQHFSTEKQV